MALTFSNFFVYQAYHQTPGVRVTVHTRNREIRFRSNNGGRRKQTCRFMVRHREHRELQTSCLQRSVTRTFCRLQKNQQLQQQQHKKHYENQRRRSVRRDYLRRSRRLSLGSEHQRRRFRDGNASEPIGDKTPYARLSIVVQIEASITGTETDDILQKLQQNRQNKIWRKSCPKWPPIHDQKRRK